MVLNDKQEEVLSSLLKMYMNYNTIRLPPRDAIDIIQSTFNDLEYTLNMEIINQYKMKDSVDFIRRILKHPCPQNKFTYQSTTSEEDEQQGLLGLTIYNIEGVEPVCKEDVCNFIMERLNQLLEMQIDRLKEEMKCELNNKGCKTKIDKILSLIAKAWLGDHAAMNQIGIIFALGKEDDIDWKSAIYHFERAAKRGNSDAQINLALCYYYRMGVWNDSKIVYWTEQSCKQNNQLALGFAYLHGIERDVDHEKAFNHLVKANENENIFAMSLLAFCYKRGYGVEKDIKKAFELLQICSGVGFAPSMYQLGNLYKNGNETDKDQKAFLWYQKSANIGFYCSQFKLAVCFQKGIGTEVNPEKAFYWYMKAAEQGSESSMFNVACCYYEGFGVEKSYEKAVEWYRKGSFHGNIKSTYALGLMYADGLGVEQSKEEAVKHFRIAADRGFAPAQFKLGECYEKGIAVTKNIDEAIRWYTLACENGQLESFTRIGNIYNEEIKDVEKAFQWFKQGAEKGVPSSQFKLAFMYMNGSGVEKNSQLAIEWFEKAYKLGEVEAAHEIAGIYYTGDGVPVDLNKAFHWCSEAASKGHTLAQYNLGVLYERGEGVEQDVQAAQKWFKLSAEKGYTAAIDALRKYDSMPFCSIM